ncbi:MAG: hypothetical protein JW795_16485, partial [Chitinivibrionales bacterium]|nr:hypothetical protein [Chitinivibrionales bacterium]
MHHGYNRLFVIAVAMFLSGGLFWSTSSGTQKTIYGGIRASAYGLGVPETSWFSKVNKNMALRFRGTPCTVWIASTYDDATSERILTFLDNNGIKAFIQVEPYLSDVSSMIDRYLTKFKKHACVIGFGVDVEWYNNDTDGDPGEKVTDAVARGWVQK